MKKIFLAFLLLYSGQVTLGQVVELNVRNVQNFEHPVVTTNDAIKEKTISYISSGKTESKYILDFNSMKLIRNMDGLMGQFEIVDKVIKDNNFSVFVKFPNGVYANYIYQVEDDGSKTLYCKWIENNKVVGWFDKTIY